MARFQGTRHYRILRQSSVEQLESGRTLIFCSTTREVVPQYNGVGPLVLELHHFLIGDAQQQSDHYTILQAYDNQYPRKIELLQAAGKAMTHEAVCAATPSPLPDYEEESVESQHLSDDSSDNGRGEEQPIVLEAVRQSTPFLD